LFADIGHFEQIRVKTGVAQGIAEDRFVRARGAGRHHYSIDPVLEKALLHARLTVVRAGVDGVFGMDDVGEPTGPLDDLGDVHHGGDIAAAMAYEDAHPRGLIRDVAFRGIMFGANLRAARGSKKGHRARGSAAGLHDGIGNVLRLLESSADKHAGSRRVQRAQFGGLRESPFIQGDADVFRLVEQRLTGLQSQRQHNHVEFFFDLLEAGAEITEHKVPGVRHLDSSRDKRTHVPDAEVILRALIVPVKIFPEGSHIQEEYRDVEIRVVFFGENGFFGRGHTAHGRAVIVAAARVARADALYESQALGGCAVGRPLDMALCRTRGRQNALELHVRNDIAGVTKPELAALRAVKGVETGSQNHRADFQFEG